MIILNNLSLPLETDFENLISQAAKALKTEKSNIKSASLFRKSVDARRKDNIHFCCSLLVDVKENEAKIIKRIKNAEIFKTKEYKAAELKKEPQKRPIIVGFGPAGMFAALTLAHAGARPIVLERGGNVDERTKSVEEFFGGGKLNPNSNVQFGEGGAGTFSDGKLNTGIKDTRCRFVLETFYKMGADKNILTDAKPHIGTDILKKVVKNIRKEIISLGGEIRFNSALTDIEIKNNRIVSAIVGEEKISCDNIILATGHSARDTFKMLYNKGIKMERKPFSVGVRIEHLQSEINKALYGKFYDNPALKAADYKMAVHLENGRGVYTFCMCPGGYVMNSSSEEARTAVNGMSEFLRDGENANSALLVGINPEDIGGADVLEGIELQRKIEENAYKKAQNGVPVQTVGSFLNGKENKLGAVKPTVKPKAVLIDIGDIFPSFVTDSLKEALPLFAKKIKGFDNDDALLTAPETRSSSPVRILRDENHNSLSVAGLFPCGEGAGYAGGIMSAAVDGIKTAEALINRYNLL